MSRAFLMLVCFLGLTGCRRPAAVTPASVPAAATAAAPGATASLKGMYVVVTLHRGALGMARENSVPMGVDSLDGNSLTLSGHVQEQTEQFLVLGKYKEREKNEGLKWIPYGSILSIDQPTNQNRTWHEPPETAGVPWRLQRLENLMSMTAFDLTKLPEGQLEVWIARKGEKEMLDTADTLPGKEQWMYFGLAPANDGVLFMSVIGKEGNGGNLAFFNGENLKPFRKTIQEGHDWTKAAVIAVEATGEGKIYAQLKRKE